MKFIPLFMVAGVALLTVCTAQQGGGERDWRNAAGQAFRAEFIAADANTATLRAGGKDYQMPIAKLSPQDQTWVRQKMAAATTAPVPAVPKPAAPITPEKSGGMTLGGVAVKSGARMEFETPLSPALQAKLKKHAGGKDFYKDVDMSKAQVGVFFPDSFDPAKSWPIMLVSVTDSGRAQGKNPSSVKAMGGFIEAARELGWVVIGADCPGYLTPGNPSNRAGLAEAALEAMAVQWPASKNWPVATGGFSGGAKYSGWLGGWFAKEGRKVLGMFMGGVNEDAASASIKEWQVPRSAFGKAHVFISTGKDDNIAGPAKTKAVIASLKGNGFKVQEEIHDGGHQLNKEHVLAAMKDFAAQQ